jgi:2-polyprenyl-3-methyl-5-hydroxy-6-metoxy-1,4-benzoquinol methylase
MIIMETDWTKHWNMDTDTSKSMWGWRITHAYRKLLENVKMNDVKILELGSGSGFNSLNLARMFNAKEVTLVDSNEKAIDISKRMFKGSKIKVNFLLKDALKLNIKEKFDIVHSEGLIEHFYGDRQVEIFKKHISLCKDDGVTAIFAPQENINYRTFRWLYKSMGKWIWDEKPVTIDRMRYLAKKADARIVNEYSSPLIHEIGVLLKKSL